MYRLIGKGVKLVIEGLMSIIPFSRVELKQIWNERLGIWHVLPFPALKEKLALADVCVELFVRSPFKWWRPSDQYVKEHANTPHVGFLVGFFFPWELPLNPFGRHIVQLKKDEMRLITEEIGYESTFFFLKPKASQNPDISRWGSKTESAANTRVLLSFKNSSIFPLECICLCESWRWLTFFVCMYYMAMSTSLISCLIWFKDGGWSAFQSMLCNMFYVYPSFSPALVMKKRWF